MKNIITVITTTAALSLLCTTPLRGTATDAPTASSGGIEQAARQSADAGRGAYAEATRQFDEALQQYELVESEFATARDHFQLAQAAVPAEGTGGFGVQSEGSAGFADRLQTLIRRTGGEQGKVVVIRSGGLDANAQANLEEDLMVMSRILDKALDEELGASRRRTAMGIDVVFGPSTGPGARSLYLDGYGALFMLNVSFPLLPPPPKPEEPKEKEPVDSTWEQAKRELQEQRAPGDPFVRTLPYRALRTAPEPPEEYSEEKMIKLKDTLLGALKSGTNIRRLKSDDLITVCVFGGSAESGQSNTNPATRTPPRAGAADAVPPPPGATDARTTPWETRPSGGSGRGTVLTLRVKKSDVDAFAKGRLDLNEFRKKAEFTAYTGGANAGSGNAGFRLY